MVKHSGLSKAGGVLLCVSAIGALTGCESDSFMDPSVIGRWEQTPTVVPILDRLSAIEDETGDLVDTTPITPADLIPEPDQYRLSAGDSIEVRIRDFFTMGVEEPFTRVVDPRGNVELPRLPAVRAHGRTSAELQVAIEEAIRGQRINDRPTVAVTIQGQRKQTFSVLGAARTPGSYFIPSPDYRLLEGITAAGGVLDETQPYVFVIRQMPLTDEAAGVVPPPEAPTSRTGLPKPMPLPTGEAPKRGEDLIELIDELSKQPKPEQKPAPTMRRADPALTTRRAATSAEPEQPRASGPAIDLPDSQADVPHGASPKSGWVYLDGQWQKVTTGGEIIGGEGAEAAMAARPVTQRVIKVPLQHLLAGKAGANIVLRPGDVVRVPPGKTGLVYFGGQVNRPGVINLPAEGKLTLLRAIDSVGGLGGLAIPERTDLTRIVGEGRQATIRINLRAIAEQTQPDIYMKPDDRINVGTNFFAVPLAVFRGGFRASYGFGFILDRNFQGDVFGVDEANVRQ